MAWTESSVFRAFLENAFLNDVAYDLEVDSFKVALYDNDITPDKNALLADTAYNVGQWVSLNNEVFEAGQWEQAGQALGTLDVNASTAGVVFWDAADTSSGVNADLANVHGCLVYDDTIAGPPADVGICYNYFGGANSVVNGTFTVVWAANGIWRATL